MATFQCEADVYSPRWGHPDRYTITMTPTEMTIKQGMNSAVCKVSPNADPVWTGYGSGGNPLMNVFSNDQIYAPEIVPFALENAYKDWLNNNTNATDLEQGLKDLFAWVDLTARNKPKSKVWQHFFVTVQSPSGCR
jgi:hypothetical protein